MTGIFRTTKPFMEADAWKSANLNALRYQTSQAGMVIPIVYGTTRVQFNLLAIGEFFGPGGGKKGKKAGPLPITGTSNSIGKGGGGKGSGGKKGAGGKKTQDFSVDVDMGLCQGPVQAPTTVWSGVSHAPFGSAALNIHFYNGHDNQTADPTFAGLGDVVGYSGTAHVTVTPMDLGPSPVLPNLSFEIPGLFTGVNTGTSLSLESNPSDVVHDFLSNPRYGAGFPAALIDPDIYLNYGTYCQAAGLLVSIVLDGQQKAAEWVDGLMKITNSAVLWSGKLLRFIPYGDVAITANSAIFTPNLTWQYSLNDNDFIPSTAAELGGDPEQHDEGPILLTRSNPADATNWLSVQYTERSNAYNPAVLAVFDQGAIDAYGLRTGDSIQAKALCNVTSAQAAAQILLQRLIYIRNIYRFQLSWKYALLEPMDIVLLTGRAGDQYLFEQPVRILSIEENDNGELTMEAEEIQVGVPAPYTPPVPVCTEPSLGGLWADPGIGSGIVLLDSSRVAHLATGPIWSVMSTTSHAADEPGLCRWYFEFQDNDDPANFWQMVVDFGAQLIWHTGQGGGLGLLSMGFASGSFNIAGGTLLGTDSNGVGGFIGSGYDSFFLNSAQIGHLGTFPVWNDDITADPSTGVGGFSFAGVSPGPYFICASFQSPTHVADIRIGTSTTGFRAAVPTNCKGW